MRRRKDDCSPSTTPHPPNAFSPDLLAALDDREPEPVAPGAELPGPWRVTRLWGDGPPLWAVYGLGEPGPRLTFKDAADGHLAHLTAAALAIAQRPRRFRFQRGGDDRLHLMHDGAAIASAYTPELETTSFTDDLTRLADLREQPLALAQLLHATPAAVLRRAGAILLDELGKVS